MIKREKQQKEYYLCKEQEQKVKIKDLLEKFKNFQTENADILHWVKKH